MPDSKLKIILDLDPGGTRDLLGAVRTDLTAMGAAADESSGLLNKLDVAMIDAGHAADALATAQRELADNTDPTKQAELEEAVARAQVELNDEAESVRKLAGELDELEDGTEQVTTANDGAGFSFTELNSALSVAKQAYAAIKGAIDAVVNPTIEYAKQIRDLGRTIGATAEETSKLIQAADDVGISTDILSSALEVAIRKGVRPSIEGIAALADEYNAIQDPIERAKYLMDNFGRSGADLAPLMELGEDGIRAAGEAAEAAGLVMSQDGVQAARDYEIALDDLEDSALALKLQISQGLVPALTELFGGMSQSAQLTRLWREAVKAGVRDETEWAVVKGQLRNGFITLDEAVEDITSDMDDYRRRLDEVDPYVQNLRLETERATEAALTNTDAIDAQVARYQGLADAMSVTTDANYEWTTAAEETAAASMRLNMILGGAVGNELKSYTEGQAELEQQLADVRAEIEHYNAINGQSYKIDVDAVDAKQNLTIAMAAQETAADTLSAAQQALSENTDPDKQLQLEAAVARAEQALGTASGKVDEWNSTLATSGDTYVTDYRKKLEELGLSEDEITRKIEEHATAHEESTERILFGYVQQAVAAKLSGDDQILALTAVAVSWGMIDQDTADAVTSILEATDKLADDGSIAEFQNDIDDVRDSILGVPTDINVTYHVSTIGSFSGPPSSSVPYGEVPNYTNADARASGGPIYPGNPYWTGEEGPELIFPSSPGHVMDATSSSRLVEAIEAIAGGGRGRGDSYQIYVTGNEQAGISVAQELELRSRLRQ